MAHKLFILWLTLMVGFTSCRNLSSMKCVDLTLNYRSTPICVSGKDYRFGWSVKDAQGNYQTHYQLQISNDKNFEDGSVLFDPGKQASGASQDVRPNVDLPRQSILYWRVKIWDDTNAESAWSDPFQFFSSPSWTADWISTRPHEVSLKRKAMPTFGQKGYKNPQDTIAVYMRKKFEVEKGIKQAHVYISGLGYYELTINDQRIGTQVLDPAFSDFQKRVFYNTFEVTDQLNDGENTINVTLGNGFYNLYTQNLFMLDQSEWKGPHKLLFQLHILYNDNSSDIVVSNESWTWGTGPIVFNSIMGGETYDARKQVITDKPVVASSGPGGQSTPQLIPAMEINKRLDPVEINKLDEQTYLVDFGENITGSVELRVPGCEDGRMIMIFYNEALDSAGYLQKDHSKTHTRGRFQEDRMICNGEEFQFQNHFSYFGFRYAQVENFPGELKKEYLKARSIHTALESESSFQCSNRRINELHAAVKRTLKNSIHSMPGEEPTREKMGWTFDAGMNTMESYLYDFNTIAAYEKYLVDLVDAQAPGGHIPPIVPTNGWGFLEENGQPILYDDPWWGGTILYVMDELVHWTGDPTYYSGYYNNLKAYTDFVHSTADSSLVVHWSLGDWLDPQNFKDGWGPGLTSIELSSTLGLYYLAEGTGRIAGHLGKIEDSERYVKLAQEVKDSFLENLYNEKEIDKKLSQTGHALPLWLDVFEGSVQDSVYQNLKNAIHEVNDHIYSGFIGIKPIMETLADQGDKQLAFDMIMQEASPGWLHMVKDEYSTMGENMNAEGYGTGHHPFGANIGYWFYKHVLGLKAFHDGWKRMVLKPFLPNQLENASGYVHTPYGEVSISIERKGDNKLECQVNIPFNTKAEFIPMGDLVEGFENYTIDDTGHLELPAGTYTLTSTMQ